MTNKLTAFVNIYEDRIEITGEDGMMHSYWVKDAGIHPEHLYPCVMVDLLLEIKNLQELGFEIFIKDER